MVGKTNVGGSGVSSDVAYAYARVEYPSGSICTATNGTKTLTAPDTNGLYVFELPEPSSTPETWSIQIADSANTKSQPITISSRYQFEDLVLLFSRVPAGYQEVEYILCTSVAGQKSPYFDTGIGLLDPANTEIDFSYMFNSQTNTSGNVACVFGSTYYGLRWRSGAGVVTYTYSNTPVGSAIRVVFNEKHDAVFNKHLTHEIIDNDNVMGYCEVSSAAIDNSSILYGLARNQSMNYFDIKLYEYVRKDNNVVVQDLIPCINASQVPGFYDVISDTFIQNSGEGTLTAGPVVQ